MRYPLNITGQIHLVSGLEGRLPFSIDDASRAENELDENPDAQFNRVLLDTRLNNRVVDLRVRLLWILCIRESLIRSGARPRRIRLSSSCNRPSGPSSGSIWTRKVLSRSTVPSSRVQQQSLERPSSKLAISKVGDPTYAK